MRPVFFCEKKRRFRSLLIKPRNSSVLFGFQKEIAMVELKRRASMFFLLFFTIGIIFGSFFMVVGTRLPLKQSIISPPSHCVNCQVNLTWYELLPLISYLFLRGKCRSCQKPFGSLSFFIELVTGVFFMLAYGIFSWSFQLVIALLFISMLIIITVSDWQYFIIQNRILLVFGPLLYILCLYKHTIPLHAAISGAMMSFILLALFSFFSNGGIGGGDVKLYLIIGFVLGYEKVFLSLFLASLFGLLLAACLKRGFGKQIPFAPAIAIASIVVLFWGEQLLNY